MKLSGVLTRLTCTYGPHTFNTFKLVRKLTPGWGWWELRFLSDSVIKLDPQQPVVDAVPSCGDNDQTWESRYIKPTSIKQMLMEYFDRDEDTINNFIMRDKRLKQCDVYTVAWNINIFKKQQLDPWSLWYNLPLFYRNPLTTEHRAAIIDELLITNPSPKLYLQFNSLFKSEVGTLKTQKLLSQDYDPWSGTLGPLGLPTTNLAHLPPPSSLDNMTLEQVHRLLTDTYLTWRLEVPLSKIFKIRKKFALKLKSVRLQEEVLVQLWRDWNIGTDKVLRNAFILSSSPINLDHIKTEVVKIGGDDLRQLVSLSPSILNVYYHHLLQIDDVLRSFNVPPNMLTKTPRLCMLSRQTLQQRLESLYSHPSLGPLMLNPRSLVLVMRYNKVMQRVNILQTEMRLANLPSINVLIGSQPSFEQYCRIGHSKHNRKDCITFLSEYFKVDEGKVSALLHEQCWGPHTTVVNAAKNMDTLVQADFTHKQILDALDLALCSTDLVQSQLKRLPSRPDAQPYPEAKTTPWILQLLLYFVHREMKHLNV